MPVQFPDSPSVNQEYTYNGVTYFWNGAKWVVSNGTDAITISQAQTLTNKTLTSVVLDAGYAEEIYTLSGSSNVVLDVSNGSIQLHTLTANTSYVENLSSGESLTLFINDGNAYTVTWPEGVTWKSNTAPTLVETGNTVVELWKINSTLYGTDAGDVDQ
jgi:hypothetical protein